jgi:dihydrodipicolinate synthase/N-acetylneuraminate lyase
MKKLFGVTVAMITPLDKDGQIMETAIRKHVDFLIDKGVNCLYPGGTTGEMYLLSVVQRKKLAETVVHHTAGRVTVFIHVGAMAQNDTIELAKHAAQIGADGIGVVTPSFFAASDREMEEYFVAVAQSVSTDFPMYVYNIPQCSTNDLKADVIERVVKRVPNVIGVKYSFVNMFRAAEYLKINNGNFSVLMGEDRLLTEVLAMGGDGVISGSSSVYPEPLVALYKAFLEGNLVEARKQETLATEVFDILKNGNIAYFKAALKMRGIDVGHMHRPLLDLAEAETVELQSQLRKYFLIK